MDKRISVMTVCYNAVNEIENTILSVINQTYSNIEYIIIDGGSKDGTVDIIKRYEDHIAKWVSEPDKGIYDAMNKGISMATGDYVNFMNAGDVFFNCDVLEKVAQMMSGDNEIVFGDVAFYKDDKLFLEPARPFYEHLPLHHAAGFNHQCTFVKADCAKKHPFNTDYKLAADYHMIISLFRAGYKFEHINIPIAIYDLNGESRQKWKLHLKETLCIDNPNRNLYNKYLFLKFSFKRCLMSTIKPIVTFVSPGMIEQNRRNKGWIEVEI